MPLIYSPLEIFAEEQTPEIPDILVMQTKFPSHEITSTDYTPPVVMVGIKQALEKTLLRSNVTLALKPRRIRRPLLEVTGLEQTKTVTKVVITPEKFIVDGVITYNNKSLRGSYLTKGTYIPIKYIISGDRLEHTKILFVVKTVKGCDPIITKTQDLGVIDTDFQSLDDGRDTVTGTIVLTPEDTLIDKCVDYLECRYDVFVYNNNIRKYLVESGSFTFRK